MPLYYVSEKKEKHQGHNAIRGRGRSGGWHGRGGQVGSRGRGSSTGWGGSRGWGRRGGQGGRGGSGGFFWDNNDSTFNNCHFNNYN